MKLERFWEELEADQTWRTEEILFFQNQCEFMGPEDKKDQFRRATVLLLYAHFEGFCKFAFTLYVRAINAASILCKDAHCAIVAASLSNLFKELRNPSKKSLFFRNTLPDDSAIHIYARDIEFVTQTSNFENRIVCIPDDVADPESNLNPIVLRKILYRLGFRHDEFARIEGNIHELLNYRNKIAHGEMKEGIERHKYEGLRDSMFFIMNEVKSRVMTAIHEKAYLRTTPAVRGGDS